MEQKIIFATGNENKMKESYEKIKQKYKYVYMFENL